MVPALLARKQHHMLPCRSEIFSTLTGDVQQIPSPKEVLLEECPKKRAFSGTEIGEIALLGGSSYLVTGQ